MKQVEAEAARAAAESKQKAEEEASKQPKTTFGDGTYLVNKDIQPGTYRNSGGSSCYYERLSGLGGGLDDIISNENAQGPAIVNIAPSDMAFKSNRCGTWNLAQ